MPEVTAALAQEAEHRDAAIEKGVRLVFECARRAPDQAVRRGLLGAATLSMETGALRRPV